MVATGRIPEDKQAIADRQTASLAALAVTLGLVVAGVFLCHALRHTAELQDCLLSGRTNCAVVLAGR